MVFQKWAHSVDRKKTKLDCSQILHSKMRSRWVIVLKVRNKGIIKFIQDNIVKYVDNIEAVKDFLKQLSKINSRAKKNNESNYIEIKGCTLMKETNR